VDRDGRFFFVEEMQLRPVGLGQERGGEIIRWTSRRASLFGGPAARDNFVSACEKRTRACESLDCARGSPENLSVTVATDRIDFPARSSSNVGDSCAPLAEDAQP
jgi:hypothetical protein